jgi:hypothetical protein
MAKANRSDLDAWNVDEQHQRQRALQLELVEKLKRRQDAGEILLSQQEIDGFKGRPVTDEEMDKLKEHIENKMMNNNIQTKTTWSDTERWVAAIIATLGTFGFIYWLYTIGYLLHFGIYTFLTWLVIMIVFIVKHLIDELIDGR